MTSDRLDSDYAAPILNKDNFDLRHDLTCPAGWLYHPLSKCGCGARERIIAVHRRQDARMRADDRQETLMDHLLEIAEGAGIASRGDDVIDIRRSITD